MDNNFRVYLVQRGRSYRPEGSAQMGGQGFHDMGCMCKIGSKKRAETSETVRVFLPRDR